MGLGLSLRVGPPVPFVSFGCPSGIHPEELAEVRTMALAQLFTRLKGHTWPVPGLRRPDEVFESVDQGRKEEAVGST